MPLNGSWLNGTYIVGAGVVSRLASRTLPTTPTISKKPSVPLPMSMPCPIGFFVGKVALDELLIDDGDHRRCVGVAIGDGAAAHEGMPSAWK